MIDWLLIGESSSNELTMEQVLQEKFWAMNANALTLGQPGFEG